MTETVIVYRNRSEEAIDQFLYDSGAAAWIIPIVGTLIVGGIVYTIVNRIAHKYLAYKAADTVSLVCGCIAAGPTFAYLSSPLWG